MLHQAFTAINRTTIGRAERHLRFYTTLVADDGEHFSFASVIVSGASSSLTAFGAASRFVLKAFFGIEFLLGSRESEFNATFFAS